MALNLAFVGLKGHWYSLAEEVPGLPEVRLVAVVDDDPGRLSQVATFPGAGPDTHTYADFGEMLAHENPDIVIEAGNDRDRADIVVACAERGIGFIAEKPLVKEMADLDRVQAAVKQNGVPASMMITMRCSPQFLAMREAIADGLIGEVCQAGAQKSYRLGERPAWQQSRETFSGIIPFIGIHSMDLIRWTTGREFAEVMGYAANVAHPGLGDLEDNACVIARLDNSASAAIRLDYCRPAAAPSHGDDRLRLAGDRGVIETMHGVVTLVTRDQGLRELPLPAPVPFLADFVAALQEGRPPFIPFADCVRITEVALAAREAAEIGRPIKL